MKKGIMLCMKITVHIHIKELVMNEEAFNESHQINFKEREK
jgi:hypothetical protein